jgi:hypothetical protein
MCGLCPRVMDRDRGLAPPWTTQWHRLDATGAWRCAHRSLASSHSRTQKLTSKGQARRGKDGEADAALTRAQEAARRPGDDGKVEMVEGLGGDGA